MRSKMSIKLYGLFSFFSILDFLVPIKVVYFYQLTNSYTIAASILSFAWIFSALLEVPTGIFSDFVGRKRTIILGSFCLLVAYFMYALGSDYWVLVFGAFLEGISKSLYSGNNNAYLHNLLKEENQEQEFHHFYGRVGTLLTIGSSSAALLSGFVANWSFSFFMWVNLIPQAIAFILALFLKDIKKEERVNTNVYAHLQEAVFLIKSNLKLRYLSLSSIFGGAGRAAYEFQAAVYSAVWPTWAIGIARWLVEILILPGYLFASRLINKWGKINLVMLGTLSTWMGNILAGLLQSFISPFIIVATHFTYGPSDTAEQSLLQEQFSDKQRATIASINSFGSSIYFSIVALICGFIANKTNPFFALITTQVFYLPVIYYRVKLLRLIKNDK